MCIKRCAENSTNCSKNKKGKKLKKDLQSARLSSILFQVVKRYRELQRLLHIYSAIAKW